MTHQRLHTDSEVCMYALTVSTIEPKNIKEAMADHSWIESMQDELNQFERLQVWNFGSRQKKEYLLLSNGLEDKCDAEKYCGSDKIVLLAKGYKQKKALILKSICLPVARP
ncbi:hypothetical protein Tco_1548917 [Tanacetum coccineum]